MGTRSGRTMCRDCKIRPRWPVLPGVTTLPRLLAALGLSAAVLGPAAPHLTGAAAATASPIAFGEPVTVDAQRFAGEPNLVLAADGRRYVSAPWGLSTQTAFLWRSEDAGESYRQVQVAPHVQLPYAYRSGGDTEYQAAGPAAPGQPARIYVANQDDLAQNTCGYSDDAARTFTFIAGINCPQSAGADREWLATTRIEAASGRDAGHDIEYLWYDHFGVGTDELHRSDDGLTYSSTASTRVDDPNLGALGNPGNAVADPRTGVVYVTAPTSGADGNGVAVGWTADGGATLHVIAAVRPSMSLGTTGTDFTVLAIDSAGGLDLTFSDQGAAGQPWRTFLVHSTGVTMVPGTGGHMVPVSGATSAQWSAPVALTGPGSGHPEITHSVFPWVTAGDPGRVAVAFYGTSQPLTYDPNSQAAPWSTDVIETLDAQDAAPVTTLAAVAPLHTHLSSICFNGVGCTGMGNRNMLDFFEVRTDPATGAVVVVYNDDANTLQAVFPGGPFDMVSTQVSGPTLRAGTTLDGTPLRATYVADRAGDGFLPTVDTSTPALDLLGTGVRLTDPASLEVRLDVADLTAPVTSLPASEAATGVTYLVSWHWHDDLWYAAAHVNAAGVWTFDAGQPQSVPFTGTGGPKFAVYSLNPHSSPVTGAVSGHTIRMTVPTSLVGGPAAGAVLREVTGTSLADIAAPGTLSDQADATPSFADPLALAPATGGPGTAGSGGTAPPTTGMTGLANTSGAGAAPTATAAALVGAGMLASLVRRGRRRPIRMSAGRGDRRPA